MAEAEILQAFELCDKDGDGIISIEDMSQVRGTACNTGLDAPPGRSSESLVVRLNWLM